MSYPHNATPAAQSFQQWSKGLDLQEALTRAQDDVREHPTHVHARWLLFELLCVMGAWERALKQLQTCATLNPQLEGTAQTMRGLIKAEYQREEVFGGRQMPAPVIDFPTWVEPLAQALQRNATQDPDSADKLRQIALAQAPESPGHGTLGAFRWLSDTDTRLGPVCELVTAGSYRWLPFCELQSIMMPAPERLLDLVWVSAQLSLRQGTGLKAYIPARYPLTASSTDAQRLARETIWHDIGASGVFGHGQKTWMTEIGDWPLLDIRSCEFTQPTTP